MIADAATNFSPSIYKPPVNSNYQSTDNLNLGGPAFLSDMNIPELDPESLANAAKNWMQKIREGVEDRILI